MLSITIAIPLLGAAIAPAAAQWVKPPTDLISATGYAGIPVRYKQVPTGICEQDPNVKSFSGYADVEDNQHLFFWFFEARNQDPTTAPLTVWINGGPGSSSMIGLWQELGPCGVDYFGNVYNNPYSWSNVTNLLVIDQPTETGFSYSEPVPGYIDDNGYIVVLDEEVCPDGVESCGTYPLPLDSVEGANSTQAAAPNFWKALQGFMGAFPQYSSGDFNFATESYGGHYGPVFNAYIEEQNAKNIPGAKQINLKNVLIGNGWFEPITQYAAYYNFSVFPGNSYGITYENATIDQYMYDQMYGPGNCKDQLEVCKATGANADCQAADNWCYGNVELIYDEYLNRDEYDARELGQDPFPYEFYVDYLNQPEVLAAIGAFINFTEGSSEVSSHFDVTGDDGRESGTIGDVQELLADGVAVHMYFGDADYICNWVGGEVVADLLGVANWDKAGYVNLSTSDDIVHGQTRQIGKFSFTRFYEAGHEVPFYQPLASLEFFDRAINGWDIATGTVKVGKCYHTKGTPKSDYKEGNATVQYDLVPNTVTYNTTTNAPGLPWTEVTTPPPFRRQRAKRSGAGASTARTKRTQKWLRKNKGQRLEARTGTAIDKP